MPGLLQRSTTAAQFTNGTGGGAAAGSLTSNDVWSKHSDVITSDQLQKFWNELPVQARQELLRIDKQTLFEQARKNLYCSRCNGLLLEGFSQIIMYGKSLQLEGSGTYVPSRTVHSKLQIDGEANDVQHDPAVHPWGGLSTTRDGILTVLDCFINAKSLKTLQNVFNNARARERERELLYPDACGGGGRGWISQGMASYGRGHGTRETCALHTARLSCDTLVDFWSALSDETRFSLLRMKEEDFIERLMYRFDSKRFCRDCRRNVIREFKELKELKRMRREPRCSSWFCVADAALQYEVTEDTVQADWHRSFPDSVETYHRFEWAIGTGEGKSDILDFEDVGMNGKIHVNGLDLGGFSACFITVRAWKLDGRCTELCVKAHALKGQPCVHRRLIVGDGFVTITKGDSIMSFFEHAEEAEEEEDDDAMEKDGSEYDGDGSRPQKHAKSPELAREFLLDAAIVIFKEQVEKAFREGTARQNAHSIFICLALKLLEERIHVACKEIITLEKQIKLLEEEEKEKREEEERKERKRTKEREKKLRRKERLKGKEREKERKRMESNLLPLALPVNNNDSAASTNDDSPNAPDYVLELDNIISLANTNKQSLDGLIGSKNLENGSLRHQCQVDGELSSRDGNDSFILEQSKLSKRKTKFKNDCLDPDSKWFTSGAHRSPRERVVKNNGRNCNLKYSEKYHYFSGGVCNDVPKDGSHNPTSRPVTNRTESSPDVSKPLFRNSKYNHGCHIPDSCLNAKGKHYAGGPSRDVVHTKQVWEPMDARKKWARSSSDPDITSRTVVMSDSSKEVGFSKDEQQCELSHSTVDGTCSSEFPGNSCKANSLSSHQEGLEDSRTSANKSDLDTINVRDDGFILTSKSDCYSKDYIEEAKLCRSMSSFPTNGCDPTMISSSSDNCSSCLSEGDRSTSSSNVQNAGSSSTSDSEDASQQSDGGYVSTCNGNAFHACPDDKDFQTNRDVCFTSTTAGVPVSSCTGAIFPREEPASADSSSCNDRGSDLAPSGVPVSSCIPAIAVSSSCSDKGFVMDSSQQHMLSMHNQNMHVPVFPSPTMGYHNRSASAWSAAPTGGLMPFPQHNHYVYSSPFGYGLVANQSPDFQIQYNTVQPLAAPLLSLQHSLYPTTNGVYVAGSKEQIKNLNITGAQQINDAPELLQSVHPLERPLYRQHPSKPPSTVQNDSVRNVAKPNNEIPSFSLFHFGGPLAGAAEYCGKPVSPKENKGASVSHLPTSQSNLTCSMADTTVEEYSLFATSAGARFSFF